MSDEEVSDAAAREEARLMKSMNKPKSPRGGLFSKLKSPRKAKQGPKSPRRGGGAKSPRKGKGPKAKKGGAKTPAKIPSIAAAPSAASQQAQAEDRLFSPKESDQDRKWVNVQIQGLSAWVNSYLGQSKAKNVSMIESLADDVANGVKLNQFVEVLAQKSLRYDSKPRMKIQSLQNISTVLEFIQNELGVRLVGIGAEDIYGKNVKLILGLLWSMFRALRLGSLKAELGDGSAKSSEAQMLIAWVQKQVEPAPYALKVDNWADFRDGRAFGALLNIYDESFLDYGALGDDNVENIRKAMSGFEEHLKIPQLIDAQEVADGTADERSMTLYTSLIYHAHATAQERIRLRREQQQTEAELEAQRRAAEEARLAAQNLGGELEHLRGENQKLLERALAAEEMARRANSALDVLRRNLLEHVTDLEHWRDLSSVDQDSTALKVYDAEKINANLTGKPFDDQVEYLGGELEKESRNLTRIMRVQDSKRDIEDTVFKKASLFMKMDKAEPWKQSYFQLYAQSLAYFSDSHFEKREGQVDLTEPGTTITLLKPETGAEGEQLFPIKLKMSNGMNFYLATLSKHDRKMWGTLINGRLVHFTYLTGCEEDGVRPDSRVVNLCNAPADCPSIYLDNGSLSTLDLTSISNILPLLEDVNVVSFSGTDLLDEDVPAIGPGLAKASVRVIKMTGNGLTDVGATALAKILTSNRYAKVLDVSSNQIGNAGVIALAELVTKSKRLKTVNVEANKISDVSALCTAIAEQEVPILSFSKNDIGDEGVGAIAALVTANHSIIEINLSFNSIGDAGVATLCEALKMNQTVLRVDLSQNEIGPIGVQHIHKLLQVNKIIRIIKLSGNDQLRGGSELVDALQDSSLSLSSFAFSRE